MLRWGYNFWRNIRAVDVGPFQGSKARYDSWGKPEVCYQSRRTSYAPSPMLRRFGRETGGVIERCLLWGGGIIEVDDEDGFQERAPTERVQNGSDRNIPFLSRVFQGEVYEI